MSLMVDVARVAAGVNIVLLLGLLTVWIRNYREVPGSILRGLILFGSLLLAENVVALYFYFNAPAMPPLAVEVMMVLQVLESVGIAVLFYTTWQ
ncbi:hypothetical protein EI982_09930 [Haloplanus rallus]|jgi:hypothetical protein|uniref:Histidine kinase n=1 Tax=Haloplanus rallus TaxID=1816183 RepID=A0A6B9F993_9EURY|nr:MULTISPECIES: hypothetical protein [Haloplanus]QGX95087.1 hypothetical protein EI982_09930 [Haloplanus rallus]